MKEEVKKEIEKFRMLHVLHDCAKESYNKKDIQQPDFTEVFQLYKQKNARTLFIKIAAAAAALIVFGLLIWNQNEKAALEDNYFLQQAEWIALSDEALLTNEYINILKTESYQKQIENEWLWIELD